MLMTCDKRAELPVTVDLCIYCIDCRLSLSRDGLVSLSATFAVYSHAYLTSAEAIWYIKVPDSITQDIEQVSLWPHVLGEIHTGSNQAPAVITSKLIVDGEDVHPAL